MELMHALLYGLVEGITEFLPISSTGHLMLVTHLLGGDNTPFIKSFEIVIQLGAILAIVCLYPKRLLTDTKTILRVALAFIPTAILGLLFYNIIKMYLLGSVGLVLAALFIGGVAIILIERYGGARWKAGDATVRDMPIPHAIFLGVLQCVAFIPGVSRSAMTIFGGMFFRLSRKEAVEFSFFLAVPTMAAATALDILKNYDTFTRDNMDFLAVGFIASFVVALLAAKWLTRYVTTHDFTFFGIYRIIIATLGYLLFFN